MRGSSSSWSDCGGARQSHLLPGVRRPGVNAVRDAGRRFAAEDKEDRLRRRLREPAPTGPRAVMAGLRLEVVRDAVGPEIAVIIEETGGVLGDWVRDAVGVQAWGIAAKSGGHSRAGPRDGIAAGPGPP
jgi:hypothetical protein